MNLFLYCGDIVHLVAFIILLNEILRKRNCSGISGKAQLLFATVFICRYTDLVTVFISFYNTWMKIMFIGLTLIGLYLIYIKYRNSYDQENDSFWNILLVVPGAALAVGVNYYSLNDLWSFGHYGQVQEILWTFSIYLESVAIIPQYYMYKKSGQGKRILLYVTALCFYRSLYIVNWVYRYMNENRLDVISLLSGSLQTSILIIMIIDIIRHKEQVPKWQEITQVFSIDTSKTEEPSKNVLYVFDVKKSKENDKDLLPILP